MTNSPAHDLVLYLVTGGVGQFGGNNPWSLSVNAEAAEPHNTITLYDTPGGEPDTDELNVYRPSFQVRVRGLDFNESYNKHKEIRDLLIRGPIDAETSRFTGVMMSSDVMSLGQDDNKRYLLTANYRSRRTEKEA